MTSELSLGIMEMTDLSPAELRKMKTNALVERVRRALRKVKLRAEVEGDSINVVALLEGKGWNASLRVEDGIVTVDGWVGSTPISAVGDTVEEALDAFKEAIKHQKKLKKKVSLGEVLDVIVDVGESDPTTHEAVGRIIDALLSHF